MDATNSDAARESAAITEMIRVCVGRGESLAQISRRRGISLSRLVQLARAAKIRYPHKHQDPETIQRAVKLVVDEGLTFREAAKRLNWTKTSVHRFVMKHRRKHIDRGSQIHFQTRSRFDPRPESSMRWRCPKHGLLNVRPCVACEAERARGA